MTFYELLPMRRNRKNVPARRAVGRDPFYSLERLRNEFLDDFFGDFALSPFSSTAQPMEFVPRVNVTENDKGVYLSVELPGMDENDIEVSVADDAITIKGEKKEESEEKGKNYYRTERSYGSFQRVIALPDEVDSENAEASFTKGVLTITLPKVEPAKSKAKKIEIKGK
jgi:HSP20 family protein